MESLKRESYLNLPPFLVLLAGILLGYEIGVIQEVSHHNEFVGQAIKKKALPIGKYELVTIVQRTDVYVMVVCRKISGILGSNEQLYFIGSIDPQDFDASVTFEITEADKR